jgi:hypothetical protein
MKIPDPKAHYEEFVLVLNYRANPARWEAGTVVGLRYENMHGSFHWSYDVRLERRSKAGNPLFLYVGNAKIRRDV